MQNKNKVVLPEVGVSWRTTPNTKRSLNFLIFTTFSLFFQSYRKNKNKDCCVFTIFFVSSGIYTCFSNMLKNQNNRPFFTNFLLRVITLVACYNLNMQTQDAVFSRIFFSHFLSILHRSFTHINNQNTVDNFCIILANCEAYTL